MLNFNLNNQPKCDQLTKLHTLSFGPITDPSMITPLETDIEGDDDNQTPFLPIKTMLTHTMTEKE